MAANCLRRKSGRHSSACPLARLTLGPVAGAPQIGEAFGCQMTMRLNPESGFVFFLRQGQVNFLQRAGRTA